MLSKEFLSTDILREANSIFNGHTSGDSDRVVSLAKRENITNTIVRILNAIATCTPPAYVRILASIPHYVHKGKFLGS